MTAQSETIDLSEVVRTVARGWKHVVAGVAIGVLAAVAVLVFATGTFRSTASVVVRAADAGSSLLSKIGLSGSVGSLGGASSPIETEVQVLTSESLAEAVVDSLGLQVQVRSPRRTPASALVAGVSAPGSFAPMRLTFDERGAGTYQVTGAGAPVETRPDRTVDVAGHRLTLVAGALPRHFEIDLLDTEDAVRLFQKQLSVTKPGGEVIAVSFAAHDSLTAAAVPNALLQKYFERRRTTDRGTDQRRVEFLAAKVDSVEHELSSAEQSLRRYQESSGVLDPSVIGRLQLEDASSLRKELGSLDVERGALNQLLADLGTGKLTARQIAAYPVFLRSSGINDLLGQLSTLETKRYEQLATLTPNAPEVVALTAAIKNVEGQIPPLARSYAASLEKQRTDVSRQLDTVRTAIQTLPGTSESSVRLQRQVLRLAQIQAALQTQLVEAKLAAIGEGGDVRPLDVARPPRKVSFPQPVSTLGIGVGSGLALGVVLAILFGTFGRYVSDARLIERRHGVPALSLETGAPLLIGAQANPRSVLLVPLDDAADTAGVAERLMHTAASRALRGTILDLRGRSSGDALVAPGSINAHIARLATESDMVVVRVPPLPAESTIAALDEHRPVLLVAAAGRVDRYRLDGTLQTLQRLSIPCAGVVLSRSRGPLLGAG